MTKYLQPKARNLVTGETVKTQDLTGARIALTQQQIAQYHADQLAMKMTQRTGDTWVGFYEQYTPTHRR